MSSYGHDCGSDVQDCDGEVSVVGTVGWSGRFVCCPPASALSDAIALLPAAELADSPVPITRFALGQAYPALNWGVSSFTEARFVDSEAL